MPPSAAYFATPAFANTISSLPFSRLIRANRRSRSPRSDTSLWMPVTLVPLSSTAAANSGARRPVTKAYAPSLAKRLAAASPMPLLPPVTRAILPSSLPMDSPGRRRPIEASGGGALDRNGRCLAAADAEAGNAPLPSVALQCMQQGDDDPRAGGADRMPERAGAAMDVHASAVDREIANGRHRHHCERLVDLEQVDVPYRPIRLLQHFADGGDRRGGEPPRFLCMGGVGHNRREDRQAETVRGGAFGQHEGGRAVGIRAGACRGHRAAGAERRLEARDF